jgi:hypothetical protein
MKVKEINCQSCGMPLNKDKKAIGTEADGTLSELYCSHCYENGKFTFPDITVDEMRAKVTEKIVEMKIPRFVAKFLTRNTRKLKRWKRL